MFMRAWPIFVSLLAAVSCREVAYAEEKRAASYLYEDTRRLVVLVEEAADLMEQQGEEAFSQFDDGKSKWLNRNFYLFVYTLDGTCVFHPFEASLVGQDLMDLKDMNGKPVIQMITDIGKNEEPDAAGWVFYFWEERTELAAGWKSSYIRKVVMPDGRICLVGAGLYDIKMELEFLRDAVNQAVTAIQTRGTEAAFKDFRDPSKPFYFLETSIFVMDGQGHALVDPAYPTLVGRDLSKFQDAVGRHIIQDVLEKLSHQDEAWFQYLWPKPGATLPSRKIMFVRKMRVDSTSLIIGCDAFMATPIWMKL